MAGWLYCSCDLLAIRSGSLDFLGAEVKRGLPSGVTWLATVKTNDLVEAWCWLLKPVFGLFVSTGEAWNTLWCGWLVKGPTALSFWSIPFGLIPSWDLFSVRGSSLFGLIPSLELFCERLRSPCVA